MTEILNDFKQESRELVDELSGILDVVEEDLSQKVELERYGQIVDRIMGGAKNLALMIPESKQMASMGAYAEICKAIGYRGSQIPDSNEEFLRVVVAFLQDATEMLSEMVDSLDRKDDSDWQAALKSRLLDRLHWIAGRFDQNMRSSVAIDKGKAATSAEDEIRKMLSQWGLGD